MLPGPTHIVRCPRCQQLGKYETISSGNTIGATYYTDGKRVAPMLPDMPSVVACSHCGGVFWRSQANDVGSYDTFSTRAGAADPAWLAAPHLQEPDEAEYFAWMEALLQEDPKRERELRLFAWWRGNDRHRRRGLQEAPVVGEPAEPMTREANMRALLPLLSSGRPEDTLIRAEVLRQLGDFDQAMGLLERPHPDNLDTAVKRLRSLCEAGDRQLRELT